MPELGKKYRTIVYELRGMGKSETVGKPGMTVTVDVHAKDLEAFMDVLGIKEAAIVGHAYGGFVGMQLAIDRPQRVTALIVACTSAKIGGRTLRLIPEWIEIIEKEGSEPLLEETMERWFQESFRREHPDVIQLYRNMVAANPPMGYAANFRGILKYDLTGNLHKIQCPTLVITGEGDRSTPVADHEFIADQISKAEFVAVPNASHTVPEEQPEEFNRMTIEFLDKHVPNS